jgi:hypothetical protein
MSLLTERRNVYRFWWGNLKERVFMNVLDVDGRIILNCILKL